MDIRYHHDNESQANKKGNEMKTTLKVIGWAMKVCVWVTIALAAPVAGMFLAGPMLGVDDDEVI